MLNSGSSVSILGISLLSILIFSTGFAFEDAFAQSTNGTRTEMPHVYYGTAPTVTGVDTALFTSTTTFVCSVLSLPLDTDSIGVFATPIQVFPTDGTDYVVLSTGIANLADSGTATTPVAFSLVDAPDGVPYPFSGLGATIANDIGTLTIRCDIPSNAESLSFDWILGTEENPTFTAPPGFPDFFKASVQTSSGITVVENFVFLDGGPVTAVSAVPFSNPVTGSSTSPLAPFPSPDDSVYNAVTCTPGSAPICSQPLTSSVTLIPYQGQTMDFIFEVGDAHDTTLDTAAFIDNFDIQFIVANTAPIANNDGTPNGIPVEDIISVDENGVLVGIDVEANDTDVDTTDVLSATLVDQDITDENDPQDLISGDGITILQTFTRDGIATIGNSIDYDPNGQFDYLQSGQFDIDILNYTVSDGNGGTDTALLFINVTGSNDVPIPLPDFGIISENGGTIFVDVIANDTDTDFLTDIPGLHVSAVQNIDVDSAVDVTSGGGSVVLSFSQDGTLTINDNETPETADDDVVTFDPNGAFEFLAVDETILDVFNYTSSDQFGGKTNSTLTVIVTGENDVPVAVDDDPRNDAYDIPRDTTLTVGLDSPDLLDNDYDVDSDAILTTSFGVGNSFVTGIDSVTVNPDGTFSVIPTTGFAGETSFTYNTTDNHATYSTATSTVSFYSVDLSFSSVAVENDVYVNIVDAFATGNTVDFTLRSENLQGTTVGSGTVLQATRILDTDEFQAHIVPSLLANPTLPANTIKFDVQVDNENPTDILVVSYRDILDDDTTTITPASGFGFEATTTDPIKWNSDIYQLGDAATLTIFDASFALGGVSDTGIDSIQAVVRTSTDPVGFPIILQEEAANNGIFIFTQHVNILFGGPSSFTLAQLRADEIDFIEASTGDRFYTYELDNNFDGIADITSPLYGATGDVPIIGKWSDNVGVPGDRIGLYRDSIGLWVTDDNGDTLVNAGDGIFILGSGSIPVVSDWNGDGFNTIGVFTPETGVWEYDEDGDGLKDTTTLPFGGVGDHPIVGDWNGDGISSIGLFRNAGGIWALDTDGSGTFTLPEDYLAVGFGEAGDIPVVGNWNNVHLGEEVGVYRPSTGEWILDEDMDGTPETIIPPFGGVGDIPIVGDWNGDGEIEIGIYRPLFPGLVVLDSDANRIFDGSDVVLTGYGEFGSIPIVGDWDNNGADSLGIVTVGAPSALVATAEIISPANDQQTQGAGFNPQVKLTCDDDDDLDGICDEWVSSGMISFSVDGAVHTQGARPLIVDSDPAGYTSTDFTDSTLFTTPISPKNDRKQMFYELDYMTGHKPAPSAIEQLVQMFADAPVNNIDGTTGIDLFITVDEDYGFHSILVPFSGTDVAPGFDQFKVNNFGTEAERERADAAGFSTGKFQYTRYIAMLHQLTDSPSASGYSEIGGNDAAITLGSFAGGVGSTEQQAGTLVHEVGHNIFLNHGGDATNDVNCKPNYLSSMNYLFQFEDLVSGRPLDFSHQRLDDLDENNLNENTGITLSTHPTAGVLNTLVGPEDSVSGSTALSATTGQAVNYNRDADSTDTGVIANINFFDSISDCSFSDLTVLEGHNDWAGIKIPFRDEATFADGLHTKVDVLNELDTDILTGIVQDIQSGQIAAIFDAINNNLIAGDFDPVGIPLEITGIVLDLGTISSLISPVSPAEPDFEAALGALIVLRSEIDALPFDVTNPGALAKESEILGLVDTAINVLEIVVNPSTDTDHDSPTANSQLNIIDNLDPFETTLTGSDPNGDILTFSIVANPSFGTLSGLDANTGVVSYTPGTSFVKTDSYQFVVNDGTTNSAFATVSIILNQAPTADTQSVILEEGVTSLLITLTGQDADADDALIFLPNSPLSGTIGDVTPIDARSASIVYTPSNDFDGFDNISFTVNDGLESSATANVKVIVAGTSVTIFNEHPPKEHVEDDGEIEPAKPAVQIHKDKPIHVVIDGTTIDVTTIDLATVFFGPIGNERSGAQGIHILDLDFTTKHITDLESDDALTGGLALDGVTDIEFHFRMSDLGIDPQLNNENGEQTLCLVGFADPPADAELPIPIQIFGCLDLTVGGEIDVGPGELLNFNPGALWDGKIKVDGGIVVLDQACTIKGDVKSKNGGVVTINNCIIDGKIKINSHGDADDEITPTGGSLTIRGGSTVTGDVKVEHASLVSITDNPTSFGKNINIENSQDVTITNNNISHDLKIKHSGTVLVDGNTIGHNFKSDEDQIVTVTDNTITHDLKIKNAIISCTESGNTLLDPEGKNSGCPFIEPPPVDADGDGFFDDVDCDDSNPLVNPAAIEILDNAIDEDCDGEAQVTPEVDEDEAGLTPQVLQAVDEIGLILDTLENDGGLVDTEAIKDKDADKITKELSKAVHELTENNDLNKACEKLDKFNDKVNELVSEDKLDAVNGNLLTAAANGVKITLGC